MNKPKTPVGVIDSYISEALGCGCGCAGHTTYFLIKKDNEFYEYIFNAKMKFGSSSEYYYDNTKPIIKKILILSFKEFYDIFNDDNTHLLYCIDNYYQHSSISNKYYDIYKYDKCNQEYILDINKCLKCYQEYCSNLKTEVKKYMRQHLLDLIDFHSEKINIDMSIYLINEEKCTCYDENKNYSYYF